ncbi:hypothetical protein Pmani_023230 [Petrolisthes manimaculis]|uniref:Uncharacterized protein n=1 Tax=Petrolisthes manimaculis TaxID=1843537 RepID=A0AAE1PAH6_9EUCA|nr:hypothetical protein Pmani_023230 [Petrolisthes manimaculis]
MRCVLPTSSSITTTKPTNQPNQTNPTGRPWRLSLKVRSLPGRPTHPTDRPADQSVLQGPIQNSLLLAGLESVCLSLAKTSYSSRAGNVWKKLHSAPPSVRQEDQTKPRGTSVSQSVL